MRVKPFFAVDSEVSPHVGQPQNDKFEGFCQKTAGTADSARI